MAPEDHIEDWAGLAQKVEKSIGYRFVNGGLLLEAITHSSYANELGQGKDNRMKNNERLEFLGDAVIGLLVAKELMSRFPHASEGKLSRWRSSLVSRKTLAEIAISLNLGEFLLLGKGELRTGGANKRSILAGVLEAIVGALYLESGMEPCGPFINRIYQKWFDELSNEGDHSLRLMDKKTHLQEKTQSKFKSTPSYRVVDSWGPEHEKCFRVEILLDGKVVACGEGKSKKDAEQEAASLALEILSL